MSFRTYSKLTLAAGLLVTAAAAKPINVAILRGASNYVHTCISSGGADVMKTFLENPTAGTGSASLQNPTIHPDGIRVALFGPSTGGVPSAAQITALMGALDTTDVLLVFANVNIGAVVPAANRATLATFMNTKGVVSLHATTDSYDSWAAWDTMHAATFWNHSNNSAYGTLYRDTLPANVAAPGYNILRNGLFVGDTTRLQEELFSFDQTSASIRAKSSLNVLYTLKESSITGGGATDGGTPYKMGADHPMAWFRNFTAGGRFFYSGIGHRLDLYQTNYFHRRQIYNAVIWASKIDTLSVAIRAGKAPGVASDYSKVSVSGNSLRVDLLSNEPNTVELLTLDGKRVAMQSGSQREHSFTGLHNGTMYVVAVSTPAGRSTRLVTIR